MAEMRDKGREEDDSRQSTLPVRFQRSLNLSLFKKAMRDDILCTTLLVSKLTSDRPLTEECGASSASLSNFDAITVRELIFSKTHQGRVLYGLLSTNPLMSDPVEYIVTLLSDPNGSAIRVITSKLLWHITPTQGMESYFPLGMPIAIKEPLVENCSDGLRAVRVISPAQVVFLHKVKVDVCSPAESSDVIPLEQLKIVRLEGNRYFTEKKWAAAANRYSRCINYAVRNLDSVGSPCITSEDCLKEVLMLSYSNRAEARLRMGHHEDALKDAEAALTISPKHVKTLVRKGKAAHALGLFEKACIAFKAAHVESPKEQAVVHNLTASTTAFQQSRTGEYELSDFFLGSCSRDIPPCADFVGPVEIRRVDYGLQDRRGLFATSSVTAGKVLLATNPLAVVQHKAEVHDRVPGFGLVDEDVWEDFFVTLVDQTRTSTRKMAWLWSLASSGDHEMEIPSMELFKPGRQWVPPGTEKLEVDSVRFRGIANLNALSNPDSKPETGDFSSGIWALPSFINHSCAPNCLQSFIGDTLFLRASVDIAAGEEITMRYFDAINDDIATKNCSN